MKGPAAFFFFLFSGVLLHSVGAEEFQIASTTDVGVRGPDTGLTFSERLDGNYQRPLDGKGARFDFKAHATAAYPDGFSGDIDALSFQFNSVRPGPDVVALRWTLGRFVFSDITQLVVNHAVDGTSLDFDLGLVSLRLVTAYTGLVMRSSSGISLSLADQDSNGPLATPRFLGALSTSWSYVKDHTLTFGATAQQDLTPRSRLVDEWTTVFSPGKGGKVDTQYLSLKWDGPLADSLYYQVSGTFETGTTLSWIADASSATGYIYQNQPISAYLLLSSVDYFIPQFLSSAVGARVLFASGDSDASSAVEGNGAGNANLFVAITPTSLGTVFSPALANLGYYELNGSLKPIAQVPLVMSAKLMGFQRLVSGIVNAPGVQRLGPIWMGQEADVTASWQVVSDFLCSASLGAFLPTSGTFVASGPGNSPRYSAKLTAKLTW